MEILILLPYHFISYSRGRTQPNSRISQQSFIMASALVQVRTAPGRTPDPQRSLRCGIASVPSTPQMRKRPHGHARQLGSHVQLDFSRACSSPRPPVRATGWPCGRGLPWTPGCSREELFGAWMADPSISSTMR